MAAGPTTVYYVGTFRFPNGDAASARVLGNAKALRNAGATVVFGGWEQAGRPQDRQPDGAFSFDGFRYVSLGDMGDARLSPLRRLRNAILAGRHTLAWLRRQDTRAGDVVIAYHGGASFIANLGRLCRERRLTLVLDRTEWYSPRQLPGGLLNPVWWSEEASMRMVSRDVAKVIVISSFLERHFRSKGYSTLRVPPLVDLGDRRWQQSACAPAPQPLTLAYAGSPGRKDLLVNILHGLALARARGQSVQLNVFGPTRAAVCATLPETAQCLDQLGDAVVFHGRVDQADVPRRVMESHFTVLLRPIARYTAAGFPTKVVESLAAGVPVICNASSDISNFVRDGREGILLPDESPDGFAGGLARAAAMGPAGWERMRGFARQRAESSFDYRTWSEPFGRFVLARQPAERCA